AVAAKETDSRFHGTAERDRRRQRGYELPEERRQPDTGVDGEELRLFRIRETENLLRRALAAADRPRDVAEGVADDVGGGRAARDHLDERLDAHEHVVELVGK